MPRIPDSPKYIANLHETIRRFLEPIEGVRLNVVIRSLTGHRVLSWDENDQDCRALKGPLTKGLGATTRKLAKTGIESRRPNEVGNYIETPVKRALAREGFNAGIPDVAAGGRQSAGYPDILLEMEGRPPIYLECKTYNQANVDTTQRSFYLSPPCSKVSRDAYHLLVAFEVVRRGRTYYPRHYRLLSIEDLPLELKHEFNASNRVLYRECRLVSEGYG